MKFSPNLQSEANESLMTEFHPEATKWPKDLKSEILHLVTKVARFRMTANKEEIKNG